MSGRAPPRAEPAAGSDAVATTVDEALAAEHLGVLERGHGVPGVGGSQEPLAGPDFLDLAIERHAQPAPQHHHDLLLRVGVGDGPLPGPEAQAPHLDLRAGQQGAVRPGVPGRHVLRLDLIEPKERHGPPPSPDRVAASPPAAWSPPDRCGGRPPPAALAVDEVLAAEEHGAGRHDALLVADARAELDLQHVDDLLVGVTVRIGARSPGHAIPAHLDHLAGDRATGRGRIVRGDHFLGEVCPPVERHRRSSRCLLRPGARVEKRFYVAPASPLGRRRRGRSARPPRGRRVPGGADAPPGRDRRRGARRERTYRDEANRLGTEASCIGAMGARAWKPGLATRANGLGPGVTGIGPVGPGPLDHAHRTGADGSGTEGYRLGRWGPGPLDHAHRTGANGSGTAGYRFGRWGPGPLDAREGG